MRAVAAAAFVVSLVAQNAAAQDMSACRSIADADARLACFDQAAEPDEASPDAEPAASTPRADAVSIRVAMSRWDVTQETSPLDDSVTVVASLSPSETTFSGIGDETASLVIRCRENTTSVYIATAGMFMTGDTVPVTVRFDDKDAVASRWNISSNNRAAGHWSGSSAIPFARELAAADRLFVRIESRQRLDMTFTLVGVEEAVAEVSEACGW